MKKLLLLAAGLLGLCTLGLTSAKADSDYEYSRGGDYGCRRPVYQERYRDDCDYHPRRRVVVIREYERPYRYEDDCRPRHHRRRHVNFFLPVPPPPF